MALLCLDLNGFKRVNDTFGHDVGDELLIAVAQRLSETVSPLDHVCRSGGDEFAILSSAPGQPAESIELASRIVAALNVPFPVAGQQLLIGGSIGIACYPDNGRSRAELVRNADLALYAAKTEHVSVRVFEPSMADAVQDRLRMEEELRAAIGTDQLYLEYQPQFRTSTLEVVGFEALVRWNHPVRGKVRPDVFIPLAEETGLVIGLGRVILEQACRTALQLARRNPHRGQSFAHPVPRSAAAEHGGRVARQNRASRQPARTRGNRRRADRRRAASH